MNREQLRDSIYLLGKLVPLIIETMRSNPDTLWGDTIVSGGEELIGRGRRSLLRVRQKY